MATLRQKKLAEIFRKNLCKPGKKPSLKQMAKEAGYSDSVASQPGANITNTKGLQKLISDILPDSKAVDIHAGLMMGVKLDRYSFDVNVQDSEIKRIAEKLNFRLLTIVPTPTLRKKIAYWTVPDNIIRASGLEMYHKVMANYTPRKKKSSQNDIDDIPE